VVGEFGYVGKLKWTKRLAEQVAACRYWKRFVDEDWIIEGITIIYKATSWEKPRRVAMPRGCTFPLPTEEAAISSMLNLGFSHSKSAILASIRCHAYRFAKSFASLRMMLRLCRIIVAAQWKKAKPFPRAYAVRAEKENNCLCEASECSDQGCRLVYAIPDADSRSSGWFFLCCVHNVRHQFGL